MGAWKQARAWAWSAVAFAVFTLGPLLQVNGHYLFPLDNLLREQGLAEGASTRLLVHAARLIGRGVPARDALRTAVCLPLTDDERLVETLGEVVDDLF